MKFGIVTYKNAPQLTSEDQLLISLFATKGIQAVPVIWNNPQVRWTEFDYLILRSVWDYHLHIDAFIEWLDYLDRHQIPLLNPTAVVKKNHHKFYLKDLENNGIAIVPTIFNSKSEHLDFDTLKGKNWPKMVIKPAISASAYLTEVFSAYESLDIERKYQPHLQKQDFLIQEFMPEVQELGELSLLFFNRKYSHTVLKTARLNEFRVQSEYGGTTVSYKPTNNIIEQAERILSTFDGSILQARVDGIIRNNQFILMEIELIEPHLFFAFDTSAPTEYVKATLSLAP